MSSRYVETAVERLYLDARIIQLVGVGGRKRLHVAPMRDDQGELTHPTHTLGLRNLFLVRLQCGQHPVLDKLVHLLWGGTPYERLGVQRVVQNAPYRFKICVVFDPLNEVVFARLPP